MITLSIHSKFGTHSALAEVCGVLAGEKEFSLTRSQYSSAFLLISIWSTFHQGIIRETARAAMRERPTPMFAPPYAIDDFTSS
jgi:hypothetical protein